MNRYKIYGGTPAKNSRIKTQHYATHNTSKFTTSSIYSTPRENPDGSYYQISITRSKVSQREGYLNRRKREIGDLQRSTERKGQKRYCFFKNYQQFQTDLKIQHGVLNKSHPLLNAFGIATYRGVKKSINTHQISAHIGQMTALTLIQGYDGIFAASELKKLFSNELLVGFRNKKTNAREQPFRNAESNIRKAVQNCSKKLKKAQEERGDDSGASFLTLVVHKGIIFAVNCGSSQVVCMTKSGRLIKLAKSHTTDNKAEVDRIVREGGQLYQTIVNFPYQREMKVKGPLRVYPDGLTITRTMGKTITASKQKRIKTISETVSTSNKGVLSEPELQFIPASEVRWIAIVSSKIVEKVHQYRVRDLIEQEFQKKTKDDLDTQVAQYCCKRLILQAVQLGQTASLSALVILGNLDPPVPQSPKQHTKQKLKQSKRTQFKMTQAQTQKLNRQPRSLKYIGNRINFVEYDTSE